MLLEENTYSTENCMVKSHDGSFVPAESPNGDVECCRERNDKTGNQSNRGLWCKKGSCNSKTGLCTIDPKNVKENFDDCDNYDYRVGQDVVYLLVFTGLLGIILITVGTRKNNIN